MPNILVLRHSAGYEHSYLPDCEVTFKQLGRQNGWSVITTHRLDKVSAESLDKLDLLVFATTGNLDFSPEQKTAIIDFVRGGKAFMGVHNATDTGYDWPEFGQMLGGWFNGHPWHQRVGVVVEDTEHPATRMLGERFEVTDEIYTFKDFSRARTHVLMRLDNDSVDLSKGNREDHDYAMGWCHDFGAGRVIYTALGHPDDLWYQDWFRQHLTGCVRWALRQEA